MDRHFDYAQKILLVVEFAETPRSFSDMPPSYTVFERLPIPEVERAFAETESLFVRFIAGRKFHNVLDAHMGYWEKRVPAGKKCFVHYAIGSDEVITAAYHRVKAAGTFVLVGIYHVEPQSSAYPFAFPVREAPNHWFLGEKAAYTKESIFWFNFFPAQPYLFEKTFAVWALFNMIEAREGGVCNQLVAWEGKDRLDVNGVDEFVQVNLNRFTSIPGYFSAAHEAGKHTFTVDPEYLWYGMLLRKL